MDLPFSPAAERNQQPILEVLRPLCPKKGTVLEIASGTGQHACYFARRLPELTFLPTEVSPALRDTLNLRRMAEGSPNLLPPEILNVTQADWPLARAEVILCVNMVHISPWAATLGLFAGAGRILSPEGFLLTYGPYRFAGVPLAPSNEAFDASLRAQNPQWGTRAVADLEVVAASHNLVLAEVYPMPANNHTLIFRRLSHGGPAPAAV